jgi:hypothetical protein
MQVLILKIKNKMEREKEKNVCGSLKTKGEWQLVSSGYAVGGGTILKLVREWEGKK